MSFWTSVLLFGSVVVVCVKATRYEFILDNEEIFDNCPEMPGNNGFHDLFDISEFIAEFTDGSVSVSGNFMCAWEGVQPTDRIEVRAEVYKFQRGVWQPTPLTISVTDFCKRQFEANSIWYQVWTNFIPADERKCLNNFGHVYHHPPFDVDTVFDFVVNMEGRHKLVTYYTAFDERNVKRPKIICFQISGDFIKVK